MNQFQSFFLGYHFLILLLLSILAVWSWILHCISKYRQKFHAKVNIWHHINRAQRFYYFILFLLCTCFIFLFNFPIFHLYFLFPVFKYLKYACNHKKLISLYMHDKTFLLHIYNVSRNYLERDCKFKILIRVNGRRETTKEWIEVIVTERTRLKWTTLASKCHQNSKVVCGTDK